MRKEESRGRGQHVRDEAPIIANWESHDLRVCFSALLDAVFRSIPLGFEGSKRKIVDKKASDGRVGQNGFQFLLGLSALSRGCAE